jgi:hypothetical protein
LSEHEWAELPGWPHQVSKDGRVRRKPWRDADGCLHLGGEITCCPDKRKGKGYLYATLRDGDRRRKAHVAVLVLEAHRGPKPGPGYEACHGNGIRTDNHLSNLRWDTKAANLAQMWEERRLGAVTSNGHGVTESPFPQDGLPAVPSRDGVTGDGPHGTGSLPIPSMSSSHFTSVQPFRSLRTLFRQAA